MISQELLNFINQQKGQGVSDEAIRKSLEDSGWNTVDIDVAFSSFVGEVESQTKSVPAPLSRAEAVAEIQRMGKFKASKLLFTQSLNILRKDKEIIFFPIISSVLTVLVFSIFTSLALVSDVADLYEGEFIVNNHSQFYTLLFAFYIASFFVITYFQVGLTAVVYERINGRDIDFKDGINRATKIINKIFVWSLISATVGIVLKVISDRSKWLGKLVASLLGLAWNMVTFFIAPTLLLDDVSVWQSIKNSGNTFKKTWGETLIMNISLSLVTLLLVVLISLFYFLLFFALFSFGFIMTAILVVPALFIITLLLLSVLTSCLSEVFKVALYSYARFGIVAEGFSPELIIGAVKESK